MECLWLTSAPFLLPADRFRLNALKDLSLWQYVKSKSEGRSCVPLCLRPKRKNVIGSSIIPNSFRLFQFQMSSLNRHNDWHRKNGEGCMEFRASARNSIHQKRAVPLCRRPVFIRVWKQSKQHNRIWYDGSKFQCQETFWAIQRILLQRSSHKINL